MRKVLVLIMVSLIMLPASELRAADYFSSNFIIKDPVVVPGGGTANSLSFSVSSVLGVEVTGISSADSYSVNSGYNFYSPPTNIPDVNPSQGPSYGGMIRIMPIEIPPGGLICDFNQDNKCGIHDLSILLYWMEKPISEAKNYDLNNDMKIDIMDASILFYYWE